jgi:hypothetical protein
MPVTETRAVPAGTRIAGGEEPLESAATLVTAVASGSIAPVTVVVDAGRVLVLVIVVSSGVCVDVTTWVTVVGSEITVMRVTVCV